MSDEFFQNEEVKSVLLSRGKSKRNSIRVSGEYVDGIYCLYSSEYLRWNLRYLHTKFTANITDEERTQWLIDNPEPDNKFKEN